MDFFNNNMNDMTVQPQDMVMMQQQYTMLQQYMQSQGVKMKKTTRRDILDYLQQRAGTYDVVQVDDFETDRARHICKGGKQIFVLDKFVEPVPTSEGVLAVNYFLCPNCRRLILDKGSITI